MPPCSHCGDDGWIDLGHPSTALALRMSEDQDAQQRVSLPKRMVGYGIFGMAIGWFLGLMVSSGIGVTLAITGLCGVIGALVVLHQHRASGSPEPSVLPARWAMALPPAPGTHPEVSGPVTTTADALRAPLSGRRCIAWEVGVRHDTQADADDASWWLLEQKLVPVSVGDEALDPARTHLRVPRMHFGPLATAELDEAARLFLRQRGIGGSEVANVELFETIIEADAPVRVQIGPHRSALEPVQALVPSGA